MTPLPDPWTPTGPEAAGQRSVSDPTLSGPLPPGALSRAARDPPSVPVVGGRVGRRRVGGSLGAPGDSPGSRSSTLHGLRSFGSARRFYSPSWTWGICVSQTVVPGNPCTSLVLGDLGSPGPTPRPARLDSGAGSQGVCFLQAPSTPPPRRLRWQRGQFPQRGPPSVQATGAQGADQAWSQTGQSSRPAPPRTHPQTQATCTLRVLNPC